LSIEREVIVLLAQSGNYPAHIAAQTKSSGLRHQAWSGPTAWTSDRQAAILIAIRIADHGSESLSLTSELLA
jgi:hypothetical protein